ncbi:GntR family transcriptional regulator [Thalassotalea ganghwensis]
MAFDANATFSINASSAIPIYRQLIDQIKQAIRAGLLNAGEQAPSVRVLAKSLGINPMTISKAYNQLELEGVLIRHRGVGMIVAEQERFKPSLRLEQALISYVHSARKESLTNEQILAQVQQYLSLQTKE